MECEEYADEITAERVRHIIRGVPEAKDQQLHEGLGGSFSYYTLGDTFEVSGLLTGESLPSYRDMAVFAYHMATGKSIDPVSVGESSKNPFLKDEEREYWLFYQPDIEWLRSTNSAFTERDAERIAESGCEAIVFAPYKHLPQRRLSEMGIVFCQLPYLDRPSV